MVGVASLAALYVLLPMMDHQVPKVPSSLSGVHRIVFIGDSITQQGEKPGGYVWLLRHTLTAIYPASGIQVINSGISGNKSTDMLSRFRKDVLDKHPDLIFISVGVNDVWHGFYDGHTKGDGPLGISMQDYRANVKEMIVSGQRAGVRVRLLLATQIGEDPNSPENLKAVAYNNTLRSLGEDLKCGVVDLQTPFRKLIADYRQTTGSTQNFLTVDGIHMNAQGNQVMAQTILTHLGVPDALRKSAEAKVEADMLASRPHPGPLPLGSVLSDNKVATASSEFSAEYTANQANLAGKRFEQRWCANAGTYQPNPWWQVDLGDVHTLSGIHIVFAPDEPDSWKYKVEVSEDGIIYRNIIDRTNAAEIFCEENHEFHVGTRGRYIKIVFTGETDAQNWASLRHVQVFGTEATSHNRD